jgi:hypothetical protein
MLLTRSVTPEGVSFRRARLEQETTERSGMAWTSGDFEGRLTARAVVAFYFGKKLAEEQLVDAVKDGEVVYAAVRCKGTQRVWGVVFIVHPDGKRLHVKPISERIGPFDDRCPPRILDLLSETSDEMALDWRARCRARRAVRSARSPAVPIDPPGSPAP